MSPMMISRENQLKSPALQLRSGVFLLKKNLTKSGHLQLVVRIWDESPETKEFITDATRYSKIFDVTRRFHLQTASDTSPKDNLDVVVSVEKLNKQWTADEQLQTIHLEKFLQNPAGHVEESCTFYFKCEGSPSGVIPLQCEFVISQITHPNLAVRFKDPVEISVHDHKQDQPSLRYEGYSDVACPMSTDGFHGLCGYLSGDGRWEILADFSLGSSGGSTRFDKSNCPPADLIRLIFSQMRKKDDPVKLKRLQEQLRACGLEDGSDILSKEIHESSNARFYGKSSSGHLSVPTQCSEDITRGQRDDRSPVPDEARNLGSGYVTTRLRACAGVREPGENDEDPDAIHTLRSDVAGYPDSGAAASNSYQHIPKQDQWLAPEENTETAPEIMDIDD